MDAPVFDGHEGPIGDSERRVVEAAWAGEDTDHAARAEELDLNVPAALVRDVHGDGHVLEKVKVGILEVLRGDVERGDDTVAREHLARQRARRGPPRLGLNERPALGCVDHRPRVELAEAVLVVEVAPRGRHLPVGVGGVDLHRGEDAEVLHVAPSEVRAVQFIEK